jgi:hypothetical protein
MNQALIAILTVTGFVLVADLVTTWFRRRARSRSATPDLLFSGKEMVGEPEEGVALDQD